MKNRTRRPKQTAAPVTVTVTSRLVPYIGIINAGDADPPHPRTTPPRPAAKIDPVSDFKLGRLVH